MKKIIVFLALISFCATLNAQEKEVITPKDILTTTQDSNSILKEDSSPVQYNISMGASFGRGFFGENYTSTYLAPSTTIKINEQAQLRAGLLTGDIWLRNNSSNHAPQDKAPYANRYKHNAAFMGMDFSPNSKFSLSVTAFYDVFNPMQTLNSSTQAQSLHTYGFDASMTYEMTKNSFLHIRVSYLESNNPYSLFPYFPSAFSPIGQMYNGINPNNNFLYNSAFGW